MIKEQNFIYFLEDSKESHLFVKWLLQNPLPHDFDESVVGRILSIFFGLNDEKVEKFLLQASPDILQKVDKYLDKVSLTPTFLMNARKKNKRLYTMLQSRREQADRWKTDLSADMGELGF